MKRFLFLVLFLAGAFNCLAGREFTVMVYNVENLFDLDGVAIFSEYNQSPEGDYGTEQLLNKLSGIHQSLAACNNGDGPDVVMFQEFELDRTPFDRPDTAAFLEATRDCTLGELLNGNCEARLSVANLPSELLLLKYLEDRGMQGYRIAQPDPFKSETHPPHKNVVFTRFPVKYVRQRPLLNARDVLIVGLDIDGHELVLLNNHWKSGASSTDLEPVRVQNARVVRAELDAILYRNPEADVIVAGDLNCYYNQKAVFPDLALSGINDVMQSHGYEKQLLKGGLNAGIYNLWYELPEKERGSEVWRGKWGTLMQMLLTPGLYDAEGIQYIDNSFNRLMLAGSNVDRRWGRPNSWSNFGGGSGFSDHLPVYARFRIATGEIELDHPSHEALSAYQPGVDMRLRDKMAVPGIAVLEHLDERQLAGQLGELFLLKVPLAKSGPARIRLGDRLLQVYTPFREVRRQLDALKPGDTIHAYVELATYRGRLQVVIQDPSWVFRIGE